MSEINIIEKFGSNNMTNSKGRSVKYIVEHYSAGISSKKGTARSLAEWFNNPSAQSSADFMVDDSEIVQFNGDILNQYCWAVGGGKYNTAGGSLYGVAKNSNCISIEIVSNNKSGKMTYPNDPNYYFTTKSVENAVKLTKYLMKKYKIDANHIIRHYDVNGKQCPGITGWNDETGSNAEWTNFKVKLGENEATVSNSWYRVRKTWSDTQSQLGAYESKENAIANCPAGYSVFDPKGKKIYTNEEKTSGIQATELTGTEEERAKQILEIVHKYDDSGILPSVTAAQAILESGYGTTELALKANNMFGMKCSLSGNTWTSCWDGTSKYTKKTAEQDANGNVSYITADFRKYGSIIESIKDHGLYLKGALNGKIRRYKGITEASNYKECITIIKNGGYATDVDYISKVCSLIEKYNLNKYDPTETKKIDGLKTQYRVQAGLFVVRSNAEKLATKLKNKGINSVLKTDNGKYIVQVGLYSVKKNAELRVETVKKAGFKAIIKEIKS